MDDRHANANQSSSPPAASPQRPRAASPTQQPRALPTVATLGCGDSCLNTLLELLHMPIEAVSESIA
eukprot:COSAG01_NODE_16789_length_1204_cov_1.721267_1_plen_66_part_10